MFDLPLNNPFIFDLYVCAQVRANTPLFAAQLDPANPGTISFVDSFDYAMLMPLPEAEHLASHNSAIEVVRAVEIEGWITDRIPLLRTKAEIQEARALYLKVNAHSLASQSEAKTRRFTQLDLGDLRLDAAEIDRHEERDRHR